MASPLIITVWALGLALACGAMAVSAQAADLAAGPLRVLPANPRYFTDGSGRAVYLTGAHTWSVLKDFGPGDPPPVFDYEAYLKMMTEHHHNFLRLWAWELTKYMYTDKMLFAQPFPWPRTGPGNALDGKPKFDLTKIDQTYFDRLRKRVIQARDAGIYVSIMLFEGHGVQCSLAPWCWDGHPFNKSNNINGIDGNLDGNERGTEIYTLKVPQVTRIQEAYVRKVIDTVNDLDNVLYEVSNEAGDYSTEWQYHMINFVKACEKDKPRQHPVGMTFQFKGGTNEALLKSPADWISPGPQGGYRDAPLAADGSKVLLPDTDHLWGIGGTPLWAWKSFLRGLNPIYMDTWTTGYLDIGGTEPAKEAVRAALGHIMDLARRVDLAKMTPRNDLASTKYCLANPGMEYVVLQPDKGPLKVTLPEKRATYALEWFDVTKGKGIPAEKVVAVTATEFTPPFDGPAALHLKAIAGD